MPSAKGIFYFGRCVQILPVLLFCLFLATQGIAQVETTTSLRGIVTDASGAVVPGAGVAVKNTGTGQVINATTDGQGSYGFPSLSPGTYSVTVTKPGFKTAVVANRTLVVGEPGEVDVALQV